MVMMVMMMMMMMLLLLPVCIGASLAGRPYLLMSLWICCSWFLEPSCLSISCCSWSFLRFFAAASSMSTSDIICCTIWYLFSSSMGVCCSCSCLFLFSCSCPKRHSPILQAPVKCLCVAVCISCFV